MNAASEMHPLQVAIVGSGPSGFYAAEALLKARPDVKIDMLDRLPTPFGLVRGGVAPDHPKIKQVILVYERIARNERFSYLGNIEVGMHVSVAQLQAAYHAVILAFGASADRRLDIPGEDLPGSHTATEFVGWYNGHPDFRDRRFDFDCERAVVIGQGNVAADVARILATPVDALAGTDIAGHALDALSRSRIRDIFVIGRRGPAQAKFTAVELKEFATIRDCAAVADPDDLVLNPQSEEELAAVGGDECRKNIALFRSFSQGDPVASSRRVHFRFLESPLRLCGERAVEAIELTRNRLEGDAFQQIAVADGSTRRLDCGLVFRSVGYRGEPMPGAPFDMRSRTIPNVRGRCVEGGGTIPGLYVTGWIKRGPTGIIGTNRADSVETVAAVLEDFQGTPPHPKPGSRLLVEALGTRGQRITSYAEWQRIDSAEQGRGRPKGKPREKFTKIVEMLECLDH
ncbi:MAG: FAD-dependent oxidoreductase [Pseudorhodoplanes sp.]|uniref:FAD-dependent oxidoreductase n=1 Tax=Pseudorhodoplanes sp. TaxID=1934341 RepID=UPI003D101AAA